ncbi:hypothetical protein QKU48_gp1392 [Fadolivirus algeromassiliense]|jgi:hypothetical protein|uniref:OTU domain-containing protein n=1 Tax=Fadolivirus FV1/VV64 TaxID=3070911 RepID=A0A7D3UU40_9VIRU|nr:hypothetical protein QKU48_gp1392 [Fadolivirus algeromassiliense]QKF94850.1 hypothetical protein Fadolivirus_1_1392 [Fadolivirus FV1/VV64]
MDSQYRKKYETYKSKYMELKKNKRQLYDNKSLNLPYNLQGGFLTEVEELHEFILNGAKITKDFFNKYFDITQIKLEGVDTSAAGFSLYSVNIKGNPSKINFVGKYNPFYMNYWDSFTNLIDTGDKQVYSDILFALLGKKYNQRKSSMNESIISLYLNNISKYDINPCFIRVLDYFVSDFYTYNKGSNVILKSIPSSGISKDQLFCHVISPYYDSKLDPIKAKQNLGIFMFSLIHAFYISNKLFSFVHGDLQFIGNQARNIMYRYINYPSKYKYMCYELTDGITTHYYLFKLLDCGTHSCAYIPILHDYGRSHIQLKDSNKKITVTTSSTVYDQPIDQTLNQLKKSDFFVIYELSELLGVPLIIDEEIFNLQGINETFGLLIDNKNVIFYNNKDKFECDTKNFKDSIKFFKENNIDKITNTDIYNNLQIDKYLNKEFITDILPQHHIVPTPQSSAPQQPNKTLQPQQITSPVTQFNQKFYCEKKTDKYEIVLKSSTEHIDYKIINNEGGGDCFFYSLIDSGIKLDINGVEYDLSDKGSYDRKDMVRHLRRMAIERIKAKKYNSADVDWKIIRHDDKTIKEGDFNAWYKAMEKSSYWANHYMISALMEPNLLIIMINALDKKIYCFSPFEDILEGIDTKTGRPKIIKYNSLEEFFKSNRTVIIMWYTPYIHFECVHVKALYDDNYMGHLPINEFILYNLSRYFADSCQLKFKHDALKYAQKFEKFLPK